MIAKWITHACVQLTTDSGRIIYFDPYQLSGNLERADIILASHDHFDHLSSDDIKKISDSGTTVIIPNTCDFQSDCNVVKLDINEYIEINGIKIKGVPSYTIELPTHPKENKWLGYIVEIDGKRIYHAGDTGKIPEMADFKDIDVAFVPVGGKYTMGFDEAAESVKMINPKIVVPIHNWDAPLEPFINKIAKVAPGVKTEILIDKTLEI